MDRRTLIIFGCIVLFSAALHFYRIGTPDSPVWDEAHFATYASDYIKGDAFLDIHPPLGKLILAAAFELSGKPITNSDYVTFSLVEGNGIDTKTNEVPFADFPYIWGRIASALFGIGIVVVFFFFLRAAGISPNLALVGTFLLSLETVLLTESRLILIDGMYLFFGLLAMTFFLHKKSIFAGISFGLSLSVKFIGIIFIIPAVFLAFVTKEKKKLWQFIAVGFAVLFIFILAGSLMFPVSERIIALKNFGLINNRLFSPEISGVTKYAVATVIEVMFGITNYVTGGPHVEQSSWHSWLIGEKPVLLTSGTYPEKMLFNKSISLLVLVSIITVLIYFFWCLKKRFLKISEGRPKSLLFLVAGYAGALLPYILFVRRSTFVYHYLPALLFGIGLIVWWLDNIVSPKIKKWAVAFVLVAAIIGFAFVFPDIYGLPASFIWSERKL